jgi:hypothetical protein
VVDNFIRRTLYTLAKIPTDCQPFHENKMNQQFYQHFNESNSSSSPDALPLGLPPLIIFDEAHVFNSQNISCIKASLDTVSAIGIFLSTCSSIDMFMPKDISNRSIALYQELQPIFYLPSSDIYRDHLFHLGRPLWRDQHQYQEWSFEQLIEYAFSRLYRPSRKVSLLPLFMCRFGGLTPVSHDSASSFVSDYMAMYSYLSCTWEGQMRKFYSEIAYISEPILAEASIYASRPGQLITVEEILGAVKDQIKAPSLVSLDRGDIGEFVGCALLGYSMDFLRYKTMKNYLPEDVCQSYSCPLPLLDFLKSLCGDSLWELSRSRSIEALLEDYAVNFTHFVKIRKAVTASMCLESITRHCGMVVRDYCPAIDLVVEAYKEVNGKPSICHVRVSIKNYSVPISGKERDDYLSVIHPTLTEPHVTLFESPISSSAVAILINVGSGDMTPLVRQREYVADHTRNRTREKGDHPYVELEVAAQLKDVRCFVDLPSRCRDILLELASTNASLNGLASEGFGIFSALQAQDLDPEDARFGVVSYLQRSSDGRALTMRGEMAESSRRGRRGRGKRSR